MFYLECFQDEAIRAHCGGLRVNQRGTDGVLVCRLLACVDGTQTSPTGG